VTVFAVDLALSWVVVTGFVVCLCSVAAHAPAVTPACGEAEPDGPHDGLASDWLPDLSGPVLASALGPSE
jgi:hypothetical protein